MNQMKHQRRFLLAATLLALGFLSNRVFSDPSDVPTPLADRAFLSHLKITLDPRAATDYNVDLKQVDALISEFAAKHVTFTLNDLQNMKIPAGAGKNLLLSEIATIDVEFNPPAAKQ